MQSRAFWVTGPGRGEIRPMQLTAPEPGQVQVRTLFSAISRGTERIVFAGRVPATEYETMRAPFQDGEFPGPVKYGYLSVGTVEVGPPELRGRTVFCLYPHQSRYVVPAAVVVPVPDDVPAARAVLAGTVETGVNALWDAAPRIGDRACVIGAGMLGCCVARLLAQLPGVVVTLIDIDPARAAIAAALGVDFALPDDVDGEHEVVVHTSASAAGLQLGLDLLACDGELTELSWYGSEPVSLALGGAFHTRRLGIRASQVGTVAAARRSSRSTQDRLQLALQLLRDPTYDRLLEPPRPFSELPMIMPELLNRSGLAQLIHYHEDYDEDGDSRCSG